MSDPDAYVSWLQPGFAAVDQLWEAQPQEPWGQVRQEFLTALQLGESDLARPEMWVIARFLQHADDLDEDARRALLLDDASRSELVRMFAIEAASSDAAAATAEEAPVEPQWVEGQGWMRYDPVAGWIALDSSGGEASEPPTATSDETASSAASVAAEPSGAAPVPPTRESGAEPPTPAATVDDLLSRLVRDVVAQRPELAELPAEEFTKLVADIVAQEAASATT